MTDLILTPMGLRVGREVIPVSIGRGGVRANKVEGDSATPVGRHPIWGLRYRPDRVPARWVQHLPPRFAQPIRRGDLWCDDPAHPAYNQPVRAPFAASHEVMRRPDPLYDLVLIAGWNYPVAQPGRGSAIFMHLWRRPGYPTAGCVAMARRDMAWLLRQLGPGSALIVPEALAGRGAPR